MLSTTHLPTSLRSLLARFRLGLTDPPSSPFYALLHGFPAQVGEHTVCGMLTGAGFAQRWHRARAHRLFSHRRWSVDHLRLSLAALLVARLLPVEAAIEVPWTTPYSVFRRRGRMVFGAGWAYDGSSDVPQAVGSGNTWVILGLLVPIPICRRTVCFPILFSPWEQGSKVAIARDIVLRLAQRL